MIRFYSITVSIFLMMMLSGCYLFTDDYDVLLDGLYKKTVPVIYSDSLRNLMDTPLKPLILDTREEAEYQRSHIKGAIYVGYNDFIVEKTLKILNVERPIIVYCSIGYRSEKIAEKIIALGNYKVYNLYGGIFQWKNEGNQVVNIKEEKTDTIHAYSPRWGKWLKKGIKVYD